MTVAEAVKQSKSGSLFHRKQISYAQSQMRDDEDLICAANVTLNRMLLHGGERSTYLTRMHDSTKLNCILCVTTERIVFYNYAFGSAIEYELPLSENPKLDARMAKNGVGVGGLHVFDDNCSYYISGNRKLINYLKSGIIAAFMIYQDTNLPMAEELPEILRTAGEK